MWHVLSKYNREGNATFSNRPTTNGRIVHVHVGAALVATCFVIMVPSGCTHCRGCCWGGLHSDCVAVGLFFFEFFFECSPLIMLTCQTQLSDTKAATAAVIVAAVSLVLERLRRWTLTWIPKRSSSHLPPSSRLQQPSRCTG